MDARMQARFLVYREMLRAAGPAVPAPSLAGVYGVLKGTSALGAAGAGARATPGGGQRLLGALQGLGGEFLRTVDSLSWFVGIAVFLTWWAPYILGLVNLVLLGLFPVVMLWALIPGTQFQPLAHYFVALLFTSSAPLWWALIDQASTLARTTAPQQTAGYAAVAMTALHAVTWGTVVTILGILLVPIVTGMLMFAVFRAMGSLWRAGL